MHLFAPTRPLLKKGPFSLRLLGAALAAFYGCSDQGPKKLDLTPASMDIVSGQEQSGRVAEELGNPIVVRVLNAAGDPVPGQVVNFRVVKGEGSVFAGAALTDADGMAQERWTLGKSVADSQVVEARAVNSSTGEPLVFARFIATALPGAPVLVEPIAGNSQGAIVGAKLTDSLLVRVKDGYGNVVDSVRVDWSVVSGGGTLERTTDSTSTTGYAGNKWTLGSEVGEQAVRAAISSDVFTTFTATASQKPRVNITKYSGDNQTANPGATVSIPPAVHIWDATGSPVAGEPVTFRVTGGGGSVTGGTVVSDASGNAIVGGWTLGGQPGINTLSASLSDGTAVSFTATGVQSSPNISLSLQSPQDGLVGDTVAVRAAVSSTEQIASVKVSVAGRTANLTITAAGQWQGIVSLVGAPRDSMTLVATATDVSGGTSQAIRSLIHDRPPRLIITKPAQGAVARPGLDLDMSCDDDDPAGCTIEVHHNLDGRTLAGPSASPLRTSISLASYDGQELTFLIITRDSRGQAVVDYSSTISVESSANLNRIGSAPGAVIDADDSRLLWMTRLPGNTTAGVRNITTGTSDTIYSNLLGTVVQGLLTPTGGAVVLGPFSPGVLELYVLRNGSVSTQQLSSPMLDAAGPYLLYNIYYNNNGSTLFREDVVTGTRILVAGDAQPEGNSVSENGDVAYWTKSADVFLYHGSSARAITSDPDSLRNWYPLTDGTNVVFLHSSTSNPDIWLYNGATTAVLMPGTTPSVRPEVDYRVNGGWTAFTKVDANFVKQVWTRSPTGVLRAVTTLGNSAVIRALGTDGSVVFDSGNDRYFAGSASAPQRVAYAMGSVVWRDGRFLELLGNSAFSISP